MGADDDQITGVEGIDSSALGHMSTWIELFYDLIFVAAILIFSTAVTNVRPPLGAAWIVLVFAASWWVWFTTTLCANRYHMVHATHRLLLLSQMLVIVLMAMEARVSVTGDSTYLALEYGFLLLTIALMFFRAARRDGDTGRSYARHLAAVNMGTAGCFFVAALLPESGRLTFSAAALILLVVPSILILHRIEDFSSRDEQHMVERMGAFTLIVCGGRSWRSPSL